MIRKMNPDVKQKWLKALRSNKYVQGKNVLYDQVDGSFCCLGVLCQVYNREHGKMSRKNLSKLSLNLRNKVLGDKVKNWAGLDDYVGMVLDKKEGKTSLACLNDKGRTFTEIADIIEREL